MRDKTHAEFIERWAAYVCTHPRSDWYPQFKDFMDSQVIMANKFYKRLEKVKGKEFVLQLRRDRK
ncbi:MAG: hypothetical protein V1743_06295 [Nanoarchaeota archaeon]